MGQVYKAYDPFIGRLVALKTITNSLIGNPDLQERFYWEARGRHASAPQYCHCVRISSRRQHSIHCDGISGR